MVCSLRACRACRASFALLLLVMTIGACGDGPTASNTGPGVSATVNGARVHADVGIATHNAPGDFEISAKWPSGVAYSLLIQLRGIRGAGTYNLGTDESIGGGTVFVVDSANGRWWVTPQSGADGIVTVTCRTSTHVTGTFSVTTAPYKQPGEPPRATGTAVVTKGSFDVPVVSTVQVDPVPAYFGGTFTLNGLGDGNSTPALAKSRSFSDADAYLRMNATNGLYTFNAAVGPYHGAGTYVIGGPSAATGYVGVGRHKTLYGEIADAWGTTIAPGGTGTFTITTSTISRVAGSYTVTFPANGASPPVTIPGAFNIGRFPY